MSKEKPICLICKKEFSKNGLKYHISQTHKISSKDYYDKYFKKEGEGICKCGKETVFRGLYEGYRKYCSLSCLGKNRIISQITKDKISKASYKGADINGYAGYKHYNKKISWTEETRQDPKNSKILNVRCTQCKEWFIPTQSQVNLRIQGLKGNDINKFYCSNSCKEICPIFHKILYPINHPKLDNERPYQYEWKQMILKRSKGICEICESKPGKIFHHINPVKTHPHEVADIDNGLHICEDCDKRAHSQLGCSIRYLASLLC